MKKWIKAAAVGILFLICGVCYSWKQNVPIIEQAGQEIISENGGAEKSGIETENEIQAEPETEAAKAEEQKETVFVHICGEVRQPGVYELAAGSRVYEALAEAGGVTEAAASDYLNQAAYVSDGQKLVVPAAEDMKETSLLETQNSSAFSEQPKEAKVDINTAGEEQLMTIPGIGQSKAKSIIAYRTEHGRFGTIEEIQNIAGIKSGVYEKIKEHICVK